LTRRDSGPIGASWIARATLLDQFPPLFGFLIARSSRHTGYNDDPIEVLISLAGNADHADVPLPEPFIQVTLLVFLPRPVFLLKEFKCGREFLFLRVN